MSSNSTWSSRDAAGAPGLAFVYETPGALGEPASDLRTGVPAFLGFARDGGTPGRTGCFYQLLTAWPDWERAFGRVPLHGFLAYAVRGFFENGGRRCYVVCLNHARDAVAAVREGLDVVADLEAVDLVCTPDIMGSSADDAGAPSIDQVIALQRAILEYFGSSAGSSSTPNAATWNGRP